MVDVLNDYFELVMDNQTLIIDGLRACVFLLGLLCGLVFVGLVGKRWLF